jgi:UDP-N-acetylglucosamine:LPS N-acetylglucosamine transferase
MPAQRGCKILVLAMASWGEAGNWLSGRSLATTLAAALPDAAIELHAADRLLPTFRAVGDAIKSATLESRSPEERFARYASVLHELETRLPPDAEPAPEGSPLAPELAAFARWLEWEAPDLVVGTKGVICRAAVAAQRLAGQLRPVVDYVTNHAHFRFPVHRCPDAAVHLVRVPEAKTYLEQTCGWPADRVRLVGYLVAAQAVLRAVGDGGERASHEAGGRSVIVVSNRGGREYVELLRRLAPYGDTIDVTFIALHDDELRDAADGAAAAAGATTWQSFTELGQEELFRLMAEARRDGTCALVCKASPNSIFEAAYFGLPMFLFRTGLPMEEWGAEMVLRERIGFVEDDVDRLAARLTDALDDRQRVAEVRANQLEFARRYLDQERAVAQIVHALDECLEAR